MTDAKDVWHRDILRVCDRIPIVFAGARFDLACSEPPFPGTDATSADWDLNIHLPLLRLLRLLTHVPDLRFVVYAAPLPPLPLPDVADSAAAEMERYLRCHRRVACVVWLSFLLHCCFVFPDAFFPFLFCSFLACQRSLINGAPRCTISSRPTFALRPARCCCAAPGTRPTTRRDIRRTRCRNCRTSWCVSWCHSWRRRGRGCRIYFGHIYLELLH